MITGSISASDYLSAQRLHRSKVVLWCAVCCGIAIAVGIAVALYVDREFGVVMGFVGAGGLIAEIILSTMYLPWKANRIHRQQKEFAHPFTYSWGDEFLEGKGVSGQSKRAWAD
jgi:uncharacterized membrane protein YfcA